jgi:Ca2+-binding RTX toxin-like protein
MKRLVALTAIFLVLGGTASASMGGAGDDLIIGTRKADVLTGGPGNDTIVSRRGHDTVDGGTGFDTCQVSDVDIVSRCEVIT